MKPRKKHAAGKSRSLGAKSASSPQKNRGSKTRAKDKQSLEKRRASKKRVGVKPKRLQTEKKNTSSPAEAQLSPPSQPASIIVKKKSKTQQSKGSLPGSAEALSPLLIIQEAERYEAQWKASPDNPSNLAEALAEKSLSSVDNLPERIRNTADLMSSLDAWNACQGRNDGRGPAIDPKTGCATNLYRGWVLAASCAAHELERASKDTLDALVDVVRKGKGQQAVKALNVLIDTLARALRDVKALMGDKEKMELLRAYAQDHLEFPSMVSIFTKENSDAEKIILKALALNANLRLKISANKTCKPETRLAIRIVLWINSQREWPNSIYQEFVPDLGEFCEQNIVQWQRLIAFHLDYFHSPGIKWKKATEDFVSSLKTGTQGCLESCSPEEARIRSQNDDPELFSYGDVRYFMDLAKKLVKHDDSVSAFVWTRLSVETREVLARPHPTFKELTPDLPDEERKQMRADGHPIVPAPPPNWVEERATLLIKDLNRILAGRPIYCEKRFAGVSLGQDTRALVRANPKGASLAHLNRLLLIDAFRDELIRKPREHYRENECRRLLDQSGLAGDLTEWPEFKRIMEEGKDKLAKTPKGLYTRIKGKVLEAADSMCR